jgi:peptide/nickel transport system substrate-binding protein
MALLVGGNERKPLLARRTLLTTAAAAAAAVALGGAAALGAPRRGGILKYGMESPPSGLDPHAGPGRELHGMTYSRLVVLNDDWTGVEPDLATNWDTSADGRTYTFVIREGVRFHDGSVLAADDVVFSFERILNKATAAYVGPFLSGVIERVSAPTPSTVQFVLTAPFGAFLSILALPQAAVVSKKWVTGGGDLRSTQMGTGPMKFVSLEPNSKITLTRHTEYYDRALPYLDGISMLFMPDDTVRSVALRNGSVDFIDYVPWKDMDAIRSDRSLRMYTDTQSTGIWAHFNVRRPPLDNVLVRRAINWAANRDAMIKVAFFGHGSPMLNIPVSRKSWAYADDLPKYGYDLERAQRMVRDSGVKTPAHLEILTHSDDLFWQQSSEVLAGSLQELGFDVKVIALTSPPGNAQFNRGDFQIGWRGGVPAYADPDYLYAAFDSQGAVGSLTGYRNPRLDDLLLAARRTVDRDRRRGFYLQAYRILYDDAPWLPLAWREQGEASAAYVQGYHRTFGSSWNANRIARVWLAK